MNVVVTGASRGIGREMARIFATDENNTTIVISRSKDKLTDLRNECLKSNKHSRLIPVGYDLTQLTSDGQFMEKIIFPHFDHIDILINNAGYLKSSSFTETSTSDAGFMLAVNYSAPAELIRRMIPYMGLKGPGHVVNISSMGGVQGSVKFSGLAHYSASKSALATLTECLAEEFKESRISFNCLALGAVQTEMLAEAFPGYKAPINATEAAEFIVDFAINGHKFFNGKIIPVSVSTP